MLAHGLDVLHSDKPYLLIMWLEINLSSNQYGIYAMVFYEFYEIFIFGFIFSWGYFEHFQKITVIGELYQCYFLMVSKIPQGNTEYGNYIRQLIPGSNLEAFFVIFT